MTFVLEKWDKRFIPDIARHANNKKIAAMLRDVFPYPYTLQDAEWFVNDCMEKEASRQMLRAIVAEGQAVGSIGVFLQGDVYKKSAELGYWLSEDYWGKGIMSCAVEQICTAAFAQYDIVRIFAEPFAHNAASRRVLEKAGFVCEGILNKSVLKNGTLFDSCIYARIKE